MQRAHFPTFFACASHQKSDLITTETPTKIVHRYCHVLAYESCTSDTVTRWMQRPFSLPEVALLYSKFAVYVRPCI